MRSIRLLGLAAIFFLASGCIIVGNGGGGNGQTASLTVTYTFGGLDCQAAGVNQIRLQVTGVTTTDTADQTESCATFPQGAKLTGFSVGDTYQIMVSGLDASGNPLLQMSTPTEVTIAAGGSTVAVDVPAGSLTINWTDFNGVTSCATAGVSQVEIDLYDPSGALYDNTAYSCADTGETYPALAPGAWSAQLFGLDANGNSLFASTQQQTSVVTDQSNAYDFSLDPTGGNLSLYWSFGGTTVCGSVASVEIVLYDPTGATYDDSVFTCTDGGGETYPNLPAGNWTVDMYGYDGSNATGNQIYSVTGASVPVTAGQDNPYTVDLN